MKNKRIIYTPAGVVYRNITRKTLDSVRNEAKRKLEKEYIHVDNTVPCSMCDVSDDFLYDMKNGIIAICSICSRRFFRFIDITNYDEEKENISFSKDNMFYLEDRNTRQRSARARRPRNNPVGEILPDISTLEIGSINYSYITGEVPF